MREMKDSGNPWIGDIPVHWETKKLKYLVDMNKESLSETTDGDFEFNYIDIGSVTLGGGVQTLQEMIFSNSPSRARRVAHEGDIIVSTVRTYLKAIAKIDYESVIVSTGFAVLTSKNIEKDFLEYACKNEAFVETITANSVGISYPAINASQIMGFNIVLPDKYEQQKIATYLDKKVTLIDNIIEKTKESIEEYKKYKQSLITETVTKGLNTDVKMKASGVEWMREIPEHWEVKRGKNVLKQLKKEIMSSDEVVTCFRDGEVTLRSNRREGGFTMADKEIGYQGVDIGDLVVHGMDGFAGAIGISDSRGKVTPVLNILATYENKKFMMYYLRSMAINNIFLALSTGIRIRSCDLSWNKLATLPFPVPPIQEQEKIVSLIEHSFAKIDFIVNKKTNFLNELESYKKSLIYEVVTGKKEIN